jgi:Omp85 superfamily domain
VAIRAAVLVAVVLFGVQARAEEDPPIRVQATGFEPKALATPSLGEGGDYWTPRYEPAGFPLLGGNSDIGFELGAVATLTRFEDGVIPYLWNMDFVLSASIKNGPDGGEITQQSYLWNWDVPALLHGRLRLNPLVAYERTINEGYFGLGNASAAETPARASGVPGRYFQFIYTEARARELARIKIGGPWDLMVGPNFRVVEPGVYPGSKLAADASGAEGGAAVEGVRPLGIVSFAVGFVFDSRDNEIFPRRGQFHQASVRYVEGFPLGSGIRYEQASAIFAWFVPIGHDSVFALRGVLDFKIGQVPFYDLFTAGPFIASPMPGGAEGVRGVPIGRYLGPIKGIANAELRTLVAPLHFLGGSFRFGGSAFADAGRVWSDYSFSSPLDGTGTGLKYGVGMGAYLLWGQAAIFRMDVSYSPDAMADNPRFPLGIYVEDGTMF